MSKRLEGEKGSPGSQPSVPGQPPEAGARVDEPGAAGTSPPVQLDAEALERLHALDPTGKNQLIARVVEAFTASSARMLPQLREAAERVDLKLVRHVVHTLKSSSANVGATRLSRLCADLELQLRQGTVPELAAAVEEIAGEVTAVDDALRRLPTAR